MVQTATIYNLSIDLSNVDRGVYEQIELRIARQPSETMEYMLLRILAYCMEYREGIALTEGVASGDEPAILVRDMTGRIIAWIEVGLPDASRLHRGSKLAGRAVVYTHRGALLMRQLAGEKIHKAEHVRIYALDSDLIEEISAVIDRRCAIGLSVTGQQMYLSINGKDFTTAITEHRLG